MIGPHPCFELFTGIRVVREKPDPMKKALRAGRSSKISLKQNETTGNVDGKKNLKMTDARNIVPVDLEKQ